MDTQEGKGNLINKGHWMWYHSYAEYSYDTNEPICETEADSQREQTPGCQGQRE